MNTADTWRCMPGSVCTRVVHGGTRGSGGTAVRSTSGSAPWYGSGWVQYSHSWSNTAISGQIQPFLVKYGKILHFLVKYGKILHFLVKYSISWSNTAIPGQIQPFPGQIQPFPGQIRSFGVSEGHLVSQRATWCLRGVSWRNQGEDVKSVKMWKSGRKSAKLLVFH